MKAAGLLGLDLPPGFSVPNPLQPSLEPEDPLESDADAAAFHQDFLAGEVD